MRLIDADVLHDRLLVTAETIEKHNETLGTILADLVIDIATAIEDSRETPTVDAVPVIRCKDCIRWRRSKSDITAKVCDWDRYERTENDYCSWAKRKEDD